MSRQERLASVSIHECLKPISNYICIRALKDKATARTILMPEEASKFAMQWAIVESVGIGAADMNGQRHPPALSAGDIVCVMRHGPEEMLLDSYLPGCEDLYMISEVDVLGKLIDKESQTLQPLGNYVQIEKLILPDSEVKGVILPEVKRVPPNLGLVLATGPGLRTIHGSVLPPEVEVNDVVIFLPYNIIEISLAPLGVLKKVHLISEGDILCKVCGTMKDRILRGVYAEQQRNPEPHERRKQHMPKARPRTTKTGSSGSKASVGNSTKRLAARLAGGTSNATKSNKSGSTGKKK